MPAKPSGLGLWLHSQSYRTGLVASFLPLELAVARVCVVCSPCGEVGFRLVPALLEILEFGLVPSGDGLQGLGKRVLRVRGQPIPVAGVECVGLDPLNLAARGDSVELGDTNGQLPAAVRVTPVRGAEDASQTVRVDSALSARSSKAIWSAASSAFRVSIASASTICCAGPAFIVSMFLAYRFYIV